MRTVGRLGKHPRPRLGYYGDGLLLRREAGCSNDWAPAVEIGFYQLRKFTGRGAGGLIGKLGEAGIECLCLDRFADRQVDAVDDVRGRLSGNKDAEPFS